MNRIRSAPPASLPAFLVALCAVAERTPAAQRPAEDLSRAQCEVALESAKRAGDPQERLELFAEAARAYEAFFAQHPSAESAREAERSYVALVTHYSRALEEALEEKLGDEQAPLRERFQPVLDAVLARTASRDDDYARPAPSAAEKHEQWRRLLERAEMLAALARVAPDPALLELSLERAERELERMVQQAGETSGPGLNGSLALARLHGARGKHAESEALCELVVSTAVPEDPESADWKELASEIRAERFRLVELALPGLLASLARQGKTEEAARRALSFLDTWKREGFTLTPLGTLALLASARTLLDTGGWVGGSVTAGNLRWFESEEEASQAGLSPRDGRSAPDLALETARDVAAANAGNSLEVQARALISDVIRRPDALLSQDVPPDVLLEAALREYHARNFPLALDALKEVARSLDSRDEATRREHMPEVLFHLGECLAELQRPLEASMALREVVTTWAGNPEFQARAAQALYRELGKVRRKLPEDARIQAEYLEAEGLLLESSEGGAADGIRWRRGERAFGQQDWDAARSSYLSIDPDAAEYEKGIVKAALCLYRMNDAHRARQELEAYLLVFVADPANAASGTLELAARDEARAQATYTLGKMAFDAQDWDEVVRVLAGYEEAFPAQSEYAPNALFMSARAHIGRKDLALARRAVATLQSSFATSRVTGNAAFDLYRALEREHEAARSAGDVATARTLKQEMAHNLRLSNRAAAEPSFANLRVESTLWLELEDWEAAEESLRRTLATFESAEEDRRGDLERFVLPDLGQALLGMRRVPEAFAVLDPLVPKEEGQSSEKHLPSAALVRSWCRAVTGWVEDRGDRLIEVPGVGGAFARATTYLGQLIATLQEKEARVANEPWSCSAYALRFEQAYAFYQWSKADPSQALVAERLLDGLASPLGDRDLADIPEDCGGEALRKRLLWLRDQLR